MQHTNEQNTKQLPQYHLYKHMELPAAAVEKARDVFVPRHKADSATTQGLSR